MCRKGKNSYLLDGLVEQNILGLTLRNVTMGPAVGGEAACDNIECTCDALTSPCPSCCTGGHPRPPPPPAPPGSNCTVAATLGCFDDSAEPAGPSVLPLVRTVPFLFSTANLMHAPRRRPCCSTVDGGLCSRTRARARTLPPARSILLSHSFAHPSTPPQYIANLHDHVTLSKCAAACHAAGRTVAGIDGGNHCKCGSLTDLAAAKLLKRAMGECSPKACPHTYGDKCSCTGATDENCGANGRLVAFSFDCSA